MKNIILILSTLISLILFSCDKDKIDCNGENGFCTYVEEQSFANTGPSINNFLQTLEYTFDPEDFNQGHEENLGLLKDWLECKSCINKVVLHRGVIKTGPPIKEYDIDFIINGQIVPNTLDIIMAEELRFGKYHD